MSISNLINQYQLFNDSNIGVNNLSINGTLYIQGVPFNNIETFEFSCLATLNNTQVTVPCYAVKMGRIIQILIYSFNMTMPSSTNSTILLTPIGGLNSNIIPYFPQGGELIAVSTINAFVQPNTFIPCNVFISYLNNFEIQVNNQTAFPQSTTVGFNQLISFSYISNS